MKNIVYLISALLIVGCTKNDDDKDENPIVDVKKDLIPTEIVIKQGENTLTDAVKEGKITLEQGKNYRVSVSFSEDVELQKGEFLKMKAKNPREFYADFYGRNINKISEKVTFKKKGYNDFVLQIVQEKVVPNFYIDVKNLLETEGSFIYTDDDKKTVWVLNTNETSERAVVDMEFLGPVFLENLTQEGTQVIAVQKQGDSAKYRITVNATKLKGGGSVQLPIYSLINDQKGEQIGEITFIGETAPYYKSTEWWSQSLPDTFSHYIGFDELNKELNFYTFMEQEEHIFIDNVNNELIEEYNLNPEQKGVLSLTLNGLINTKVNQTIRVFDVYQGELVNGKIEKKKGATKREMFINVSGW
ncbi:hypothetical protein [Capnocytophaga felis]|uniref:Lipoprotein n=1 Tax=Capnocytophaga felis TaxID=2267611 RepID=A0A5M4B906_9FLAO|nr:hypothetical protein [Capnocytophaga felis]GET46094.1 hypothetical protein RCZ01_13960 [Capnocytophaga felis]GET48886.1 hypothetical protein RCZ02_17170 [Capnocytophaga felis]